MGAVGKRWWLGGSAVATALLASALVAAGCGSSTHTETGSASSTGGIGGQELKSLPRAPAPTGTAPSPAPGATTVDRSFLETSFNDAQRFWDQQFRAAGLSYSPARLVLWSSQVHSACGSRENVGPFYCSADRTIYLDLGFFDLLARHARLGGFAQAYVIGHEFGHHVQHLLGIDRRVAAANEANPGGKNARSVRLELQADCLAGVWAHSQYSRAELSLSDVEEKLRLAALIGDDFQARAAGKPIDAGLFTHGSSAQRQRWLKTGFESGDPGACDTFSGE